MDFFKRFVLENLDAIGYFTLWEILAKKGIVNAGNGSTTVIFLSFLPKSNTK